MARGEVITRAAGEVRSASRPMRGVVIFRRSATAPASAGGLLTLDQWISRLNGEFAAVLREHGVDTGSLTVIEATGESGFPTAPRPQFDALVRVVRGGTVGAVVVDDHSRLGRDEFAADPLWDALVQVGGILIVGGQVLNPSVIGDMVRLLAKIREWPVDPSWTRGAQIARGLRK